jgi:hypothetical protein
VTSRAAAYLDERNAPINDLIVCFHDGYAEARAAVEVPGAADVPVIGGAFDSDARVRGTVDFSGVQPRLVITEFEAGNLPGFIERRARDDVERAINRSLEDLHVRYDYAVTFAEGAATVVASPREAIPGQ